MQYDGPTWVLTLLALLTALVAVHILFERIWFLGWLRGTYDSALVTVVALLLVLAWDPRNYPLLRPEQSMAIPSSQTEGLQCYRVPIQEDANERSVVLDGKLWQLDTRTFRRKGLAVLIDLVLGYRLDALSDHFLALEQQSWGRRLGLSQSPLGVDLRRWLRAGEHDLFLFEPLAGRVAFLPMADKTVFAVSYGIVGPLAELMNLAAKEALRN